ncbi:related to Chitinase 1 [Phialocephala subalpina]|uniref:chitinase n=1 Tax=Phialocephala subalpina TaxID=576137 RepID=A0A1L7X4G1_9HELO|nr:related to Chitinase 1 [Phialocephala subalpina]
MFFNFRTVGKLALAIAFAYLANAAPVPTNETSELVQTYKSVAYVPDWYQYEAHKFYPRMLPVDQLSHVLYSFVKINRDGTLFYDKYAWTEQMLGGDSWGPAGVAAGGIGDLIKLKKQNRGLKTIPSIGGWVGTNEPGNNLSIAARSEAGRRNFANSAVDLVKNYGFDGIDIDWEYPRNQEQAHSYVLLLKEVRAALDQYAGKYAKGYHFQLTIACSASPEVIHRMHIKEMDQYLDAWHLMAYDFAASGWSDFTGHGSNLYPAKDEHTTPFSTDKAVHDYSELGVAPKKIVLGMPIYGRSFENTEGLGRPNPAHVSEEIEYKSLPKPGLEEHFDRELVATYTYDPATKQLVTYQGKEETRVKMQYIRDMGLGGAMWWQAAQDKEGDESLIKTGYEGLKKLDHTKNLLNYTESQFSNIKNALQDFDQGRVAAVMRLFRLM